MTCLSGQIDDFREHAHPLIRKSIQMNSIRVQLQIMFRLDIFRFTKRVFPRLGEGKGL